MPCLQWTRGGDKQRSLDPPANPTTPADPTPHDRTGPNPTGPASDVSLPPVSCGMSRPCPVLLRRLLPDLRRHDSEQHACILFDEGPPSILANRKLLHAPATWVDVGHSPIGRDVYKVFITKAVLIVCSSGWSAQCDALKLQEEKECLQPNSVFVVLHGPMCITDNRGPRPFQ